MRIINEIIDFFVWLFGTIIQSSTIHGFNPFFFLVGCIIVGAILSITFHNRG